MKMMGRRQTVAHAPAMRRFARCVALPRCNNKNYSYSYSNNNNDKYNNKYNKYNNKYKYNNNYNKYIIQPKVKLRNSTRNYAKM